MEQIPNCFYRVSAKALILDKEKRVLLEKEDNGSWELLGGWLDFWENPQETIKRELWEEVGIQTKEIKKIPSYFISSKNPKGFWIANIIYEVQIDFQEIQKFVPSEECQELRFFTKEEAEKEKLYPNVIAFFKDFDPENH